MTRLMIIVGSVRPGRIGLPIAEWVRSEAEQDERFTVDFVDLADLNLPFMDEPNHPRMRNYTHQHTMAWSARVDLADAFIFVTPEYNYSYSPALKNALDYLSAEWWHKPVGFVSYGGVSSGTRGTAALAPVLMSLGLVRTLANIEITFAGKLVSDGVYQARDLDRTVLERQLNELDALATALKPARSIR